MLSARKILSSRNYLIIYCLLILLINIYFQRLPLVKVFGYEFSLLNSLLLLLVSGIYTSSVLKHTQPGEKRTEIKLLQAFGIFLLIPPAVSVVNSFFHPGCSLIDGLFFYLTITLPSVIIGSALFLISYTFAKHYVKIIFLLLILLILAIAFLEFYLNPQVYFYNPVFGYLNGTIYDEALKVDPKLILYRVFNLLYFLPLLIILLKAILGRLTLNRMMILAYILVIPALFLYFSPHLGYSTSFNSLVSRLNKKITSDHFEIYFSPETGEKMMKVIMLHHEYYYESLKSYLDVEPDRRIISFVFSDNRQKQELFGSGNADVAKPWLGQLYTTVNSYSSSLRHEIAHVLTGEFGTGIFKITGNLNPYFLEGIATASAPVYDENDIHSMAALAYKNDFKINISSFFSHFSFFEQASSLSYVYAGSFTKYLVETYGIKNFKEFYSDINFEKIYKTEIDSVREQYYKFLEGIEPAGTRDAAYYYFGRKSIFYKICPRYAAERVKEGWKLFSENRYPEAGEIFSEVFRASENYSALIGLSRVYSESGNPDEAIKLLEDKSTLFLNTSYYYNIRFELGDLYAKSRNTGNAYSVYDKIINQEPNRILYYLSGVRKELLAEDSSLVLYLNGSDYDKYMILKKLNSRRYYYLSFPVLIDLSGTLGEDYNLFLKQFDKNFRVFDFAGSFAMYRLSGYMLENLDFPNARKISSLSLRYTDDKNFNAVLLSNYEKINWFYFNADKILSNLNIE